MAHKSYGNLPYTDDGATAVWKLTRVMKAAGWTYMASGNATTFDVSGVATNDKWGGAGDPMTDTLPTLGVGSWWLCQGPSTLKIPIGTNVPSAAMIRGEKITQATSLAEGELLGIITDTTGGTGYLVVAPRTGTFDNVNTITGAYSTATIVPSGTIIEYVREMIFWRASTSQGHWFYECVDASGESAKRFSVRAAASATAIYPGHAAGGEPGNGSMACMGTLTATAVGTGPKNWTNVNNEYTRGKTHLMCANATPATGVSADGSFILAMGYPGIDASHYVGFAFQRCDDGEDGDVDPYVTVTPDQHALTGSRTANTTALNQYPHKYGCFISVTLSTSFNNWSTAFRGFRRRGMTGETFQEFYGAFLCYGDSQDGSGWAFFSANQGDAETVATAPVATKVREPIWVISPQINQKMRKGTLRWLYWIQGGGGSNTYDNLQWVQLGAPTHTYPFYIGTVGGPWDGVTVPSNS